MYFIVWQNKWIEYFLLFCAIEKEIGLKFEIYYSKKSRYHSILMLRIKFLSDLFLSSPSM
jgi:hypothetical protein